MRLFPGHLVVLTLLIASLTACSDDDSRSCDANTDCFKGETCHAGFCAVANGGGANNGGTNNGGANNGGANNGGANNGGGQCVVNPLDVQCETDGNDAFPQLIENDTKGCLPTDEDFKPMDVTLQGRLCAREELDRFSIHYAECETRSFVVEVTLTPKTECDPSLIEFNVGAQGRSCFDPDDDIECTIRNDGSFYARLLILPSDRPAIGTAQIAIGSEEGRDDVDFDYDLNVVVRQ